MTMFNIWMLMIGRSVVFRIAPNVIGLGEVAEPEAK
jgi:hypothetical protein